ncbi:MAG: hypothetical protein GPOALKHO_001764 [Sodalis sp.]|nr:MAG: hypothetical protein GPOALKHO_001764 [Sodalis sp.]
MLGSTITTLCGQYVDHSSANIERSTIGLVKQVPGAVAFH